MTGGEISSNSAETGGGIAVYSGIVSITSGRITNNKATKSGGGMYLGIASESEKIADVTVSGNTEISGNSVFGSASGYDTVQGGGVAFDTYARGHSFTLAGNAKITGNSVTSSVTGKAVGGGMLYMTMGAMSLKGNAVVSGNTADEGADVCLSYNEV